MKYYFSLFLFPFCLLLTAQDILTPMLLIERLGENNPQWQMGEYKLQKATLEEEKTLLSYEPFIDISLSPAYSAVNRQDVNSLGQTTSSLIQSTALNLSLGWILPSRGLLSLSASEKMSFLSSEGNSLISHSPKLSLSFRQPVFVNDRFIEGRAYNAEKQVTLSLPKDRAEIEHRQEINNLISAKLGEYYQLLIMNENYQLKIEETELARRELEQLSSLRDRGLFSGSDYWEKQLEMEQSEDTLLELSYLLKSSKEKLAASLGAEADQFALPLLEIDQTMIPLPPQDQLFSLIDKNSDLEDLRLLWEMSRLNWEGGLSQKASNLSLALNLSPQYAPGVEGSESMGNSWKDLINSDSWIETTFSVNLNFSPTDRAANRILAERDKLAASLAYITWENYREELKEQLRYLLEKDEMFLKKLESIDESIRFQELLFDRETKLQTLSSTTPLAVERARLNLTTRILDKKRALVEFSQNRLTLLQLIGYDMSKLDYSKLPGGKE